MKKIIDVKSWIMAVIMGIVLAPIAVSAVVQSLNGQTAQTQTFSNDTNLTISSSGNVHTLVWSGILPVSRGGTGTSTFSIGSLIPYSGATGPVNLGAHDLTVQGMTIGLGGGNETTNTAVGTHVLEGFTTGNDNTAIGFAALDGENGLSSESNTAVGSRAMGGAISGSFNTAVGRDAMLDLTTGDNNTAVGHGSLSSLTTADLNTAIGQQSLLGLNTGSGNIGVGYRALSNLTTTNGNIGIGSNAGQIQADGSTFLTTPVNSIYIGGGTRGFDNNDNNTIVIGSNAIGAGANKAVIGNSTVTDVYFGSSAGLANIHAANTTTVSSGTSAPSSTPTTLGQMYIDTSAVKVYISTGISSSADWTLVN